METPEENNTLKLLTAEEVVPVSSEAKVVPLMLVVDLVDPDSAAQTVLSALTNKVLLVGKSQLVLLHHQWLEEKVTSQAAVKEDVVTVVMVVSLFLTMVMLLLLQACQSKNFQNL